MKKWKQTAGFTLVELIVVIAILGILAGVGTVGYSGYVKKANQAADEQLRAALNQAFAAACAANGENHYGRTDTSISLSGEEGAKEVDSDSVTVTAIDHFNDIFDDFFEGGKFKTINALLYNPNSGGFEETTSEIFSLYETLKDQFNSELGLVAASNLGALGGERVMTELATVTEWANNTSLKEATGEPFAKAFAGYLGFGEDYDEAEFIAAIQALGNPDEITANAIALYAAQSSARVTKENVTKWLDKDANAILANPNANTLGEASALYGLYMSYKGEDFDSTNGAVDVINHAMTDSDFETWLSGAEGDKELAAFQAAMTTLSGITDDRSATTYVLTNGFQDPELIRLMESLMGN